MRTDNLPSVQSAKLPQTYERAKVALSECQQIDECKDWANRAEALASYAKQADDDSLRKMADRIQARAVRRAGELLKQIDGRGDHMKKDGTVLSQKDAATEAGMSERQRKTAVRVANVPDNEFETQVESDDPPTVTNFAKQGTKPRFANNPYGKNFSKIAATLGLFRRFAEFADDNDAVELAQDLQPQEAKVAMEHINTINEWVDRFAVALIPEGK